MPNGIEMQDAMEKAFIEAIKDNVSSFTLDWSAAVDDIYKGFIRDFKADVAPELKIGETADGRELSGIVWFQDDNDAVLVGCEEPLSEMLRQAVLNYGKEEALAALGTSLARFLAQLQLQED